MNGFIENGRTRVRTRKLQVTITMVTITIKLGTSREYKIVQGVIGICLNRNFICTAPYILTRGNLRSVWKNKSDHAKLSLLVLKIICYEYP